MDPIDELKRELMLRRYALSTVKTYASCLTVIIAAIGPAPSIDAIKTFLLTIKNSAYHKQLVGTIHRYFQLVLKQPLSLGVIPYPRREYKIPEVLSVAEVQKIFDQCKNLKHRAVLSLLYGCGLRIGEVLNLQPADVDSARMLIIVRQGKGKKDRQVMLDEKLLQLLRSYHLAYKPTGFLFNGQQGDQYTDSSINQFLKYYARKAGVHKRVHAHKLRHCFATHLLDGGTDMAVIQKLLGHSNIKTTQIYAHVSTALISKIKSPLTAIK